MALCQSAADTLTRQAELDRRSVSGMANHWHQRRPSWLDIGELDIMALRVLLGREPSGESRARGGGTAVGTANRHKQAIRQNALHQMAAEISKHAAVVSGDSKSSRLAKGDSALSAGIPWLNPH